LRLRLSSWATTAGPPGNALFPVTASPEGVTRARWNTPKGINKLGAIAKPDGVLFDLTRACTLLRLLR